MKKIYLVLVISVVAALFAIGNVNAWGYTLISADSGGGPKDVFHAGETVYANAKTIPGSEVNLYVVDHNPNWGGGEELFDVSGVVETVTADASGYIPVTAIWIPGSGDAGSYDIVLDENQDGYVNENDLIDSIFEVGFWVEVPEFATIAIPVIGILGLFLFFNHRKRMSGAR